MLSNLITRFAVYVLLICTKLDFLKHKMIKLYQIVKYRLMLLLICEETNVETDDIENLPPGNFVQINASDDLRESVP